MRNGAGSVKWLFFRHSQGIGLPEPMDANRVGSRALSENQKKHCRQGWATDSLIGIQAGGGVRALHARRQCAGEITPAPENIVNRDFHDTAPNE